MKLILSVLSFLFFSVVMHGQVIQAGGPTSFCAGGNVLLSVSPTTNITGYQWINNGSNVGTGASYTASAPGSYTVKLTRTGLPDTTIGPRVVNVIALPALTVNSPSYCAGLSATLIASGASTYSWSPATGLSATSGSSVVANPTGTTIYTLTGTSNPSGCTNIATATVTVNPLPAAPAFTFTTDGQCANIQYTFNVTSPVTGNTYTWDFGDASPPATGTVVKHSFNSAIGNGNSTFTVILRAVSPANCTSSPSSKVVTVKQKPSAVLSDFTNQPPFTNCVSTTTSTDFKLTVDNSTITAATNTQYKIDWGDATTSFSASAFTSTSHTYTALGYFTIKYSVIGANGCQADTTYTVYNGSNPGIGLSSNGSTILQCLPATDTFFISNTANNPPGTTYTVSFNDGTPNIVYQHPPPPSFVHTFTSSSCGATGGITPNTFVVRIKADNPCGSLNGAVEPVTTITKPNANFTISPYPDICTNRTINFNNTSLAGTVVQNNGFCDSGSIPNWIITPSTGWIVASGGIGNSNPNNNPATWGSQTLGVQFTAAGNYTVQLIVRNNSIPGTSCRADTIVRSICVTSPPVPSFNLNTAVGCIPLNVSATNTSNSLNNCKLSTYSWSVSYTSAFCGTTPSWDFTNGTSDTSTNPSFIFNSSGTYLINLAVKNACGTYFITKTVDVKKPPAVSITPPTYPCGPVTITPVAKDTSCGTGSLTYLWTFDGGAPATSITKNPAPISFAAVGTHAITLSVTNECGTTTANSSVTVTAAPDVVVPADTIYCGGQSIGALNFSSTVGSPVYNWTNNNTAIGLPGSGTGNIASFIATNNTANPITATITVTPFINALCSGIPVTFKITVNPRPAAPLVVTPVTYCLNANAIPLTATAASGNTLTWYTNIGLTGGTTTAPTPSTSAAGQTLFYVTQTNSFICQSAAGVINVIVIPSITGNTIAKTQDICANTIPEPLTTVNTVSGGSGTFTYIWQSSTDGGNTWTNINSAINPSYAPPSLTTTIQYRRVINSSTCSDTSNVVTITVQGALTNFGIDSNQVVCEGVIPAILKGQLPTGGGGSYSYVWESSTDNINWSTAGSTSQDYQSAGLLQTTYFRRRVNASQCSSVSNVVTITVNPTPKAVINTSTPSICEYNAAGVSFTPTTGSAPFTIELTVTRPNGTDSVISQTITNGPVNINVIPANSAPGNYNIALKKITDANGCINNAGNISTVAINVKPKPVLVLSAPATICNGTSTILTVSGADTYQWSPATGLSGTTGNTITANPITTTTYTVTGILNGCVSSAIVLVTVTPGTTIANAGPDQILCDVNTSTLAANNAVTGTGSWKQVSGPAAIITDITLNNTTVTGLLGGERYVFQWTITGLPPCPPTVSNVTIDVLSPIVNTVKNDTIICNGQTVVLQTLNLSGGKTNGLDALYTYQWEMASPGQNNWQTIAGATRETFTASPATSTCYRRKVKSNNFCETTSNTVCITVNPTIGNNIISASQEVCVNLIPANLTGLIPTGGDNNYVYQWQTSADGLSWTNNANSLNYQPAAYLLAGKHFFRRNVTSGNCTSISDTITITVRPDSKAIFSSNPVNACAPFDLSKAINVTALPDSNGLYQWFANGTSIGSNSTGIFPGYTIQNPADTVLVKLKTTSQYGCKPDSMDQQFITVITAVAKFSKDTSFGCGPLPVTFNNTSNLLNSIQFFWDFGNGVKSNLVQPGTIIFNSSPFFNDTTYHITLRAYNGCDTTVWRDSVKVRANPKARFGVDTTFGCSPFNILITNTSPGGPNTYYWDFGNGKKDTTFTNGSFSYTYNIGNAVDTFTIRLVAENQCSRDTQSINVRVAPNTIKPLINVNSSQLLGCVSHTVLISNNTSGATSFTWNFGDNSGAVVTNSNQSTVAHTYRVPGVFTISVDITNGCSDTTVYRKVTVFAKPIASFKTNTSLYCESDTVRIINTSTNATNYRWFWGDGTNSSGPNPVHLYPVAGDYNILLRAEKTDNAGIVCFDTLILPVKILAKPVVTIQSNINTINCAPFNLNVTAPGIINEAVTWYIYDSTVTPSIDTLNGISAQYTFNKPGRFYAKMVAINAAGCTDSMIIRFTVRGKAIASFTPFNLAVCTRDTFVNYKNTSTYNGLDQLSYQWLVDNVVLSSNATFSHRYNVLPNAVLPRIFNTKLVVSNSVGCSDTASATFQMNPLAKAQFSISNPNACVPFKPNIVDASAYTTSYRWLLNGTLVSTSAKPDFAITKASTPYTVTLIADNVFGCKPDTFSITFTSRVRPVASFRLSDTLGCTGVLNVATTNVTTGASGYVWNWGDASANSTFNSPTHLYTTPGQYLITLVASDGVCTDTTSKLIRVSLKPVANFAASQTITCDTARVQFTNLTTNGSSYMWSFGDGTTSTVINPSKTFAPNIVPYTVKLVASSAFGCKDSSVKANLILAKVPPTSDFFISPSSVITVPNYTFNFNNLTLNSSNYEYLWSLGDGTFASTRDVTHKYVDTGNYPIRLIVLDTASNCSDTTTKIARIDGYPGYLFVPNAICPNCIQSNLREFLPKGIGLKEYRLQIYTTWNELIFETKVLDSRGAPSQAWDGKFKGTIVQQDVYMWRIDAKFLNGSEWLGMIYPGDSKYKKAGTITVVK